MVWEFVGIFLQACRAKRLSDGCPFVFPIVFIVRVNEMGGKGDIFEMGDLSPLESRQSVQ